MSAARYAVYFAPEHASAWWQLGAHWLGRDERSGAALPQPVPPWTDAGTFARWTAAPRGYGFHATLKAPMRLRGAAGGLLDRVAALARELQAVPLQLEPRWLDGFLALRPVATSEALQALAARCVTDLDDLRAPLDAQDRARRAPDRHDARGRELIERYGYPFVLERFRFHMTLTGDCDEATALRLAESVTPRVRALQREQPLVLDRLCVFREPEPGADFVREHDFPLG